MIFRILGLSDKSLIRWSKVTGCFICLMGIACVIAGLYNLTKSSEIESLVLPGIQEFAVALNEVALVNPNGNKSIEYASQHMVLHTEGFYRLWGYLGYMCIAIGIVFLYQGAIYFKLNTLVINKTAHIEKNN